MQDLLTVTAELLVIVPILFLALDFSFGLMHLYSANPTTVQEDKPEEAMVAPSRSAEEIVIAFVPTPIDPDETAPLDDAWVREIEVINQCCCKSEQPSIDFSGWSIRALKKEAQNRKLSKYSSLTKKQLISRLTAA